MLNKFENSGMLDKRSAASFLDYWFETQQQYVRASIGLNKPTEQCYSTRFSSTRMAIKMFTAAIAVCLLLQYSSLVSANDEESLINLPIPASLQDDLNDRYAALKKASPDYKPRTEHLAKDGEPHYVNRLIVEDSPYLLQHAHNPVNWYSWGEDAFAASAASNKPIFLSIGYATCHWCHVMEREVFENLEVAQYMNDNYIAVKVDREQHPDVDETFMTSVQMMTGGGGWPLSAWLTPEAKPFYGGTYFPKDSFMDLSQRVAGAWDESENVLREEAEKVAVALREINKLSATSEAVGDKQVSEATAMLLAGYDDLLGGFGSGPKFPRESSLLFLLERARATNNAKLLEAAHFSLTRIAAGGIHDQIAGGFHRYAVDADWQVPHFEKMLYNQAYLTRAYLLSHELTGDWEHARIAARTLDYVLREMTSPDGTFYSATDADSEGVEGKFFVWTPAEIDSVLNKDDAEFAKRAWRVTPEGNFEGKNILHHDDNLVQLSRELDIPATELTQRLDRVSTQLLASRQKRIPPLRDDKIITGWNGMVITALAKAADILDRPDYLGAAETAARVILDSQLDDDGRLFRINYQGRRSVDANQADYAFFAESLVALYDSTANIDWLNQAESLVLTMNELFLDEQDGGYFMGATTVKGANLPVRPKSLYDNAIPAGTSVAVRVLSQLFRRTGNDDYLTTAESVVSSMAGAIERGASNFAYLLIGVDELYNGENGSRQTTARGKVTVSALIADKDSETIDVVLDIADGWHVNAHKPIQDYLIGTAVKSSDGELLTSVKYPDPLHRKLGFDRNELALYEGQVTLRMNLDEARQTSDGDFAWVNFNVDLQACNDTTCLAPETVTVDLSTASTDAVNSVVSFVH